MIRILRYFLFPLSLIYGCITWLRNLLYDKGVLKSYQSEIPTIVIGNLSTGGTGKTPHSEFIIDYFLNLNKKVSVVSRGYKRKTKGLILSHKDIKVEEIGDEPFQIYQKFKQHKEKFNLIVDADRTNAIKFIEKEIPSDIIVLDDAFQHRKVKGKFNILLTTYGKPYFKDFVLPTGDLREFSFGKKRANTIVVTKCPFDLSEKEKEYFIKKINPKSNQKVLFSRICYAKPIHNGKEINLEELKGKEVVVITGIAKATPLLDYLKEKKIKFNHLEYPDHHNFTKEEINKFKALQKEGKTILTTEKDFVRLKEEIKDLIYLPIEIEFFGENKIEFSKMIDNVILQ